MVKDLPDAFTESPSDMPNILTGSMEGYDKINEGVIPTLPI
jgi:hypothetical protein